MTELLQPQLVKTLAANYVENHLQELTNINIILAELNWSAMENLNFRCIFSNDKEYTDDGYRIIAEFKIKNKHEELDFIIR